jgi:adenylate kinase
MAEQNDMRLRTILLFGAPGSGKGTQGRILGSVPNFYHLSCGEIFRTLTPETELGKIFLDYSSRGQLVPDEPTVRLWQQNIQAAQRAGRFNPKTDTLVLDGIPRSLQQAQMLQKLVNVRVVFYLWCRDVRKLVDRLKRRALRENRLDDADMKVIRRRLETYEHETRPVLDFYGPKLVRTIDSTQTPINVLRDILGELAKPAS